MERDVDPGALEDLGTPEIEVFRFELAARCVDQDQRYRHAGRGDLVGDAVRLAHVLQHEAEAELLA